MSDEKHEHTIGTISHGRRVYDVDWPFDQEDEDQRDPAVAFLFDQNGREVAEVPAPFGGRFTHESQVMTAAEAALTNRDIDDDQ